MRRMRRRATQCQALGGTSAQRRRLAARPEPSGGAACLPTLGAAPPRARRRQARCRRRQPDAGMPIAQRVLCASCACVETVAHGGERGRKEAAVACCTLDVRCKLCRASRISSLRLTACAGKVGRSGRAACTRSCATVAEIRSYLAPSCQRVCLVSVRVCGEIRRLERYLHALAFPQ